MRNYHVNALIDWRRYGINSDHCNWDCGYCKGMGLDPADIIGTKKCPACQGSGSWVLDVSFERLLPCGYCRGSGRKEVFGFWKVCPVCLGSGKVQ